jgi:hypothetical protein
MGRVAAPTDLHRNGPIANRQFLISDVDIAAVSDQRMALSAVDSVVVVPSTACERLLRRTPDVQVNLLEVNANGSGDAGAVRCRVRIKAISVGNQRGTSSLGQSI